MALIEEKAREFTLADWGVAYRRFVERQKFLKRWPFITDEERKAAWQEWKAYSVYLVAQ